MAYGPLGCSSEYKVLVADRGGEILLAPDGLPFKQLEWSRVLDDTSTAKVTIDTGEAPGCCDLLSQLRSRRHELIVYRDETRVWEGPITTIGPAGRDQVQIGAHDVTLYLAGRVPHSQLCFETATCGGSPADLAEIARRLIEDGLAPDDPNLLPFLQVRPCGVTGERHYLPDSEQVLDALIDLARTSIDYTAVGRSIVVGGPLTFGQLPQLTCADFASDVSVYEDGLAAATRVVVEGDGVIGTAGGLDPYYGLIEKYVKDDSIKDQISADFAAQNILRGANPPPTYVYLPQRSELAPSAPVGINDLVPGVMVPTYVDCTCRPTTSVLRLVSLAVEVDALGERVRPALVPLGA